jgi:hypothetical protein
MKAFIAKTHKLLIFLSQNATFPEPRLSLVAEFNPKNPVFSFNDRNLFRKYLFDGAMHCVNFLRRGGGGRGGSLRAGRF